jgi:hypothetical protein
MYSLRPRGLKSSEQETLSSANIFFYLQNTLAKKGSWGTFLEMVFSSVYKFQLGLLIRRLEYNPRKYFYCFKNNHVLKYVRYLKIIEKNVKSIFLKVTSLTLSKKYGFRRIRFLATSGESCMTPCVQAACIHVRMHAWNQFCMQPHLCKIVLHEYACKIKDKSLTSRRAENTSAESDRTICLRPEDPIFRHDPPPPTQQVNGHTSGTV